MADNEKDFDPSRPPESVFSVPLDSMAQSPSTRFVRKLLAIVDGPVTWWREKVVLPNRKKDFHYYHQKFRRVPTVDECYTDDAACLFEADQQYRRDRMVDDSILNILRSRMYECYEYYEATQAHKCDHLKATYKEAELNWFIKYGDLSPIASTVIDAYMKQKHRMIYERRQRENVHKPMGNSAYAVLK